MMNRRTFATTTMLAAAGAAFGKPAAEAAEPGKIGKMTVAEFSNVNKTGGGNVKALKPTAAALSKGDAKLMQEIADGGMMQLEASRIAAQKAASPDVKIYAQAEVEEQTILSEKLKEFAAAKQATLPEKPSRKAGKKLEKLQGLSGAELDRAYLEQTGVAGHELLLKTMDAVREKAEDSDLKTLAATALPLIQTHLQVAKDEMAEA